MPFVNWDIVATSAATALIVTLGIEYAAKPRLEARKERILAALRSRRELSAALTAVSLPAAFLSMDIPREAESQVRETLKEERWRQYERMRQQAQAMTDSMDRHAGTFHSMPMKIVMSYIGTMQGILLSARTRHDKAKLVFELSQQMALILDGRWWQAVARVRVLQRFHELVAESEKQTGKVLLQREGEAASPVD
ncbi:MULTISPECIES: hypothetical protein [unclassified Micromonospora]|uniref:hypothetical protein n=1 Tax=unclassified Micromonospora TaxID=2617518 RepID=UPI0003EEAFF6|nr:MULTISPECIES: hypothetical protein [unclassified Micromonospora]EWM67010.1 hypothetical protein MCBG_04143 [Micromonospora sp. M42]MCK1807076.1 hypothetical protein [Micromonospora sp. R42106]MCK1831777.1 hypothetical protein [Micromonospora sp. R42003]MCK1844513.1 hypothetical protein [Micromonospora sp. R42004]MCM1016903.1 hypothetical protein [Micromonospora sp. XM-20-01]